jgi:hypothetical protein
MRIVILLVVLSVLCMCSNPKQHAANDFYSQMVDGIVTRNNIYECAEPTKEQIEEWNQQYDEYMKGQIDSMDYVEYENEVKSNIKDTCHCVFDLSNSFGLIMRSPSGIDSLTIEAIRETVEQRLPKDFSSQSELVVLKLTKSLKKDSADFHVDYIDFLPYVRNGDPFRVRGFGTFSFSEPYFDVENKMAVIYYEYICRGRCGYGRLALFELVDDQWKLKTEFDFWTL